MITGKIILKSATKLTLDQRFGEIAKQAPPTGRIQQHTNVIIPQSRQELFGNKRSNTMNIANRLKKRSINYRLGLGNNPAMNRQQFQPPRTPRVFQRLSFGNRRRGGGANSYVFGGQSGMGVRLRGQGRVESRVFRSQKRGFFNNNATRGYGGFTRRGNNNNNNRNNNNRGQRFGNRQNRGRGGNRNFNRGRRGNGRNNNRRNNNNNNNNRTGNFTKESLDNDLEKYMAQTKIDNDAIEMNAV